MRINHQQCRKISSCVVFISTFLWIAMKVSMSFFVISRPKERDKIRLITLFSYMVATDLTSLIFTYHFIFILVQLMIRLGYLLESFKQRWNSEDEEVFDAFGVLYSFLVQLIDLINLVFRLQVSINYIIQIILLSY